MRPGLKELNKLMRIPNISTEYYMIDTMDITGELYDSISPECINKLNYTLGNRTLINKLDIKINREDYFKL